MFSTCVSGVSSLTDFPQISRPIQNQFRTNFPALPRFGTCTANGRLNKGLSLHAEPSCLASPGDPSASPPCFHKYLHEARPKNNPHLPGLESPPPPLWFSHYRLPAGLYTVGDKRSSFVLFLAPDGRGALLFFSPKLLFCFPYFPIRGHRKLFFFPLYVDARKLY